MTDYIVTQIEYSEKTYRTAALVTDHSVEELELHEEKQTSRVGFVYRAVVDKISKNIGGAFIVIKKDDICFMPMKNDETLTGSRPILVQIKKDASGHKQPVVSENIELGGKYAVISRKPGRISYSSKLTPDEKNLLKKWIPHEFGEEFHLLIRTNAIKAQKAELLDEITGLTEQMRKILSDYEKAGSGSLLWKPEPFYISMLRDLYSEPDRCFTDIPAVEEELKAVTSSPVTLRPAAGHSLGLPELYGLKDTVDKLLRTRVWLKSGAFLVIEQTEAFVSIDVNTGKCLKGKKPEETYHRINLEAAEECARQLRLRNLSGMILIDFISMKEKDHETELLNVMKKHLKRDHVPAEAIDITPLGIMEIIRQKQKKTLADEMGLC